MEGPLTQQVQHVTRGAARRKARSSLSRCNDADAKDQPYQKFSALTSKLIMLHGAVTRIPPEAVQRHIEKNIY